MLQRENPPVGRRVLLAMAALFGIVGALIGISRQPDPNILNYVLVLSVGGAAVSALLWNAPAISARTVLAVSLVAHLLALLAQPVFENDYYRFIWDGWRTLQAGTPYGIAPDSFFGDESVPEALRTVLSGINHPDLATIYGPFLELCFAASYVFGGANSLALRLCFMLANIVLICLLLRKLRPEAAALYAWNPLVIAETAIHIHPDALLGLMLAAGFLAGRRFRLAAGILFGLAAASKLAALAVWPALLRLGRPALVAAVVALFALYLPFWWQGNGVGLETTKTFASTWTFNQFAIAPLTALFGDGPARIAGAAIGAALICLLHLRSRTFDAVPVAGIFGVILLFAPAVNSWYVLWLLPFAAGQRQTWPFAASAALPLSYLTGLNIGDSALDPFAIHPATWIIEWGIIALAVGFDFSRYLRNKELAPSVLPHTPIAIPHVAVIMPALNEEAAVGGAVSGIRRALASAICDVIVVDNGSTDRTPDVARAAGATVVHQPERGYGAACLAGLSALPATANVILFMDADGSDDPDDASEILKPILAGTADLVIGSRSLGQADPGAMTPPQRFGNWLAPMLIRLIWDVRFTDLGPFRAVRRDHLEALAMQDRDYGWTVEMQVRAAKLGMTVLEVPVAYRHRIGVSKISGTLKGVIGAGSKIIHVILREALCDYGADAVLPPGSGRIDCAGSGRKHRSSTGVSHLAGAGQ